MDINSETKNIKDSLSSDYIDIALLFKSLIRNKKLIFFCSLLGFLFSIIFAYTQKKIWQGQFQIVIADDNKTFNAGNLQVAKAFNITGNKGSKLLTQIEILKSPSVLMDIYEYVRLEKSKINDNKFKNLRFEEWREDFLSVDLIKDTSVLKLSYKDYHKELILPVLQKISHAYKQYSSKNKRIAQKLSNNYLKEQIKIFAEKSSKSLKAAQDFAIDQNLAYIDFSDEENLTLLNKDNIQKQSLNSLNLLLPNVGFENIRAQASNEIRKIDLQIEKIKYLNNLEELQYIGSTIPALVSRGLPQELESIETKLADLKTKYNTNDEVIQNLIKRRETTIKLLKKRAINYLKASRLEAEARVESSIRPKEVIFRYKELIREASRDESTLISLENQLLLLKLEEAKTLESWEMTTNPTLYPFPVAPQKKRIVFLGSFFSLIIGSLISFVRDKKEDKIYSSKEIRNFTNIPTIYEFSNNFQIEECFSILKRGLLSKSQNNISLLTPLNFPNDDRNLINNEFKKVFSNTEILITNKLSEAIKTPNIFLLIKLGITKKSEIYDFYERLVTQGFKIGGILVFKENIDF